MDPILESMAEGFLPSKLSGNLPIGNSFPTITYQGLCIRAFTSSCLINDRFPKYGFLAMWAYDMVFHLLPFHLTRVISFSVMTTLSFLRSLGSGSLRCLALNICPIIIGLFFHCREACTVIRILFEMGQGDFWAQLLVLAAPRGDLSLYLPVRLAFLFAFWGRLALL